MRVSKVLVYGLFRLTAAVATTSTSNRLRVLTYNVRYDSMPDDITVRETIRSLPHALPQDPPKYYADTSEKPWSTRRIHVANDVLLRDVDIFAGQELLDRQVHDLQELLGHEYAWLGSGRDDGKQAGEYAAIFYNTARTQLRSWDTFWLSETPFDVSKYPDAGSYRVATTAHFTCRGGDFTVINTHLDDQSANQRQLGASLVLHRAKYEAVTTRRPVIVTGDFNSPTSDDAYKIVTGTKPMVHLNKTFTNRYRWSVDKEDHGLMHVTLQDLLGQTPPQRRSGHHATFTDFATVNDSSKFDRIDYIFASSNTAWDSERHHVGENLHDDGIYASDHRPVYVDLRLYNDAQLIVQH